jgi:hypothetical protein
MANPGSIPGGSTIFSLFFNHFLHRKSDTASDTILRFYSKSGPIIAKAEAKYFRG